MIGKKGKSLILIVYVGMLVSVFIAIASAETVTVRPYSDEFVIMVGSAYDWPPDDTSSGKLFYIPIKDGSFGETSFVADLGYRVGAGIGDFDNDGDLDFVAGAIVQLDSERALANFYLFENVGGGNFVQHSIASNIDAGGSWDNRVGTFAVADFNEDGFKDFVVPMYRSNHVYLFTNNKDKTFTLSELPSLQDPFDAKEGDFNEDGHMDFAITDYFNATVYLYEGQGNGQFTVRPLFEVITGYRAADITVGDFNEDGHLDIVVDDFIPYGGGGYLYGGDGTGKFSHLGKVYSRPLLETYYPYGVDSFDFDNDGHRDLILSTYQYPPAGLVFLKKGNGNGTFQPTVQIPTHPFDNLGSVFPVTPSELSRDLPPILTLPGDIVMECTGPQGAIVTFVVTAVDAIDGEVPVTCTPASGSSFPLGSTQVTCTASDNAGNTVTGTFTVTINDTMGPVMQGLAVTPDVLWPPDHKMVPVSLVVQASDTCDPNPICKIASVSSNEPENGLGDGDTAPDWEMVNNLTANLRSERSGKGSGRIYTVTVQCTDASVNTSIRTVNVFVPHDRGKN